MRLGLSVSVGAAAHSAEESLKELLERAESALKRSRAALSAGTRKA